MEQRKKRWKDRAQLIKSQTKGFSYSDLLSRGIAGVERGEDRQELGVERLKGYFQEIVNDAHRSLAGKHSKAVVELRGSGSFDEALGRITRVLQAHCTRIWLRQLPMTYVQVGPCLATFVSLRCDLRPNPDPRRR